MAAVSSKEATAYLIDPLTAPEPSQETGPGASFAQQSPSTKPRTSSNSSPTNPFRKSGSRSSHSRNVSNTSQHDKFPTYRESALGHLNDSPPAYNASPDTSGPSRRRGSSLKERFPGDDSHKPLDILRRDSKKAHRGPHLTKRTMPGTDSIDRLDPTMGAVPYHHEGPYDAASLARNSKPGQGPIAALKSSNAETLKATPVENVKNSVDRHVPLDGVAQVPPGEEDRFGRRYSYEEGGNLMVDNDPPGGAYKRWPGVDYHPDDIKGKGEPAYSQDLGVKGHAVPVDKRNEGATELRERDRDHKAHAEVAELDAEGEASGSGHARTGSGSFKDGLKKRIGSLRKKNRDE